MTLSEGRVQFGENGLKAAVRPAKHRTASKEGSASILPIKKRASRPHLHPSKSYKLIRKPLAKKLELKACCSYTGEAAVA